MRATILRTSLPALRFQRTTESSAWSESSSYIHGDDRPGAITDILAKLAGARINVAAVQTVCAGAGRYGAIVYLPPAVAREAAGVLGAAKR
jgi:hypothetical protein